MPAGGLLAAIDVSHLRLAPALVRRCVCTATVPALAMASTTW
jgi:hypothetical protein